MYLFFKEYNVWHFFGLNMFLVLKL